MATVSGSVIDLTTPAGISAVEDVSRLYNVYVGRDPDAAGLSYWMGLYNDGMSADDISNAFYVSAEFQQQNPGVDSNYTIFLTALYTNTFGRAPDQAGLDYWLGYLQSGALTPAQVGVAFASSAEAQSTSAALGSLVVSDINADRIPDLVVGSAAGPLSSVTVFEGNTGAVLQTWLPFGADYVGGVAVASGDVDGDGFDDIIAVASGEGGGGQVQVLFGGADYAYTASSYSAPNLTFASFAAFSGTYGGGMSLAVRDLNGDGLAEILVTQTAPGAGETSPVQLLQLNAGRSGAPTDVTPTGLVGDWYVAGHGLAAAMGDTDGNGYGEIIFGDLNGANLVVSTINPADRSIVGTSVLQPYGSDYTGGVVPTAISSQQTIVQFPDGLTSASLDQWALPVIGPTGALLRGSGVPGALIIQANGTDANPIEVLADGTTRAIPWDGTTPPVFAGGGVLFPQPPADAGANPVLPGGSSSPVLITGGFGGTEVSLLRYDSVSGAWVTLDGSSNTVDGVTPWTDAWGPGAIEQNSATRSKYGLIETEVVSYHSPYTISFGSVSAGELSSLTSDFAAHYQGAITATEAWNTANITGPTSDVSSWGPLPPGAVNSEGELVNNMPADLFTPNFSLPEGATESVQELFQARVMASALMNYGIAYEHHHAPTWYAYEPGSDAAPLPQVAWGASVSGVHMQGMDCTDFTSWYYNFAFGFWLNSDTQIQANQLSVDVGWLGKTLTAERVATATDIYGADGNATDAEIQAYLEATLQPGDILYISPTPVNANPGSSTPGQASHAITWMGDYAQLAGGGGNFVIDSTGSESYDSLGRYYPNGVEIREFDSETWYFDNIVGVTRWLTAENIGTLADGLGFSI